MQRAQLSGQSICDYYFCPPRNNDSPVILLLHGYDEHAKRMLQRFEHLFSDGMGIVVPNGLFPIPRKSKSTGNWKVRYAWYFFNNQTNTYLINQDYPAAILKSLMLSELKLKNHPLIILGYSQGGYLAPFVACQLPNTVKTIAINAEYKHLLLPTKIFNFQLDAINGVDDDQVDPINAQKSHQILMNQGNNGQFLLLEDTDHQINQQIVEHTKKLIIGF